MKRRMIRAIILFVITFIALLVFIALYIDETKRVQETYRRQYHTNLTKVSEDIQSYINGEGDWDLRYVRIISDMSAADSFAFLLEMPEKQKRTVNEITTCIMKYPEQMKEKLEELDKAINDMNAELDKGYDEAAAIVASVEKKGH
jgi:phosphate uptake regulator